MEIVVVIIGILGGIVGIVAGGMQILEFLQKRRKSSETLISKEPLTLTDNTLSLVLAQEGRDGQHVLVQLREMIERYFSFGELKSLCADLSVDDENLPGETKEDKIRELVEQMQRYNRLPDLVQRCHQLRPRVSWPDVERNESYFTVPLTQHAVTHNLPHRSSFVGREVEKARLHEALHDPETYLVYLHGFGGVGKSALALEIAYECLTISENEVLNKGTSTFTGIVWVTAKDRDVTLNSMLDTIARTLNYPGLTKQLLEEKIRNVEALLQRLPCLLLIDNYETVTDEDVLKFISRRPSALKILLTTREQNLPFGMSISLSGLAEQEAISLMRREGERLGLHSLKQADDAILYDLYEETRGAPLAIRWAMGQIKQKGQGLDDVLHAFRQARGEIFETMFSRSWSLLSPEAQRIVMVMPLFSAPATREAIGAACDVSGDALVNGIGQAVEMWLLEVTDELNMLRRYDVHPLTRAFAMDRLARDISFSHSVKERQMVYYAAKAKDSGRWADVSGFPWFDAEMPTILALLEQAFEMGKWQIVIDLYTGITYYLGSQGSWNERLAYVKKAIQAARECNDTYVEAYFQHSKGWTLQAQGKNVEAEKALTPAIEEFRKCGDTVQLVLVLITFIKAKIARGAIDEARAIIDNEAKPIAEGAGRPFDGLVAAEGRLEMQLGNFDQAYSLFAKSLEFTLEEGGTPSTGSRYILLGNVELMRGKIDFAEKHFMDALASSKHFGRVDNVPKAKIGLAKVAAKRGQIDDAKNLALEAREQFIRLNMIDHLDQVQLFLMDQLSTLTAMDDD